MGKMIAMEGEKIMRVSHQAKSRFCVESYSIAGLANMTLIKFEHPTQLRVDPQSQREINVIQNIHPVMHHNSKFHLP